MLSVCDGRAKVWGQMGTYTGVGADGETRGLQPWEKEGGGGRKGEG